MDDGVEFFVDDDDATFADYDIVDDVTVSSDSSSATFMEEEDGGIVDDIVGDIHGVDELIAAVSNQDPTVTRVVIDDKNGCCGARERGDNDDAHATTKIIRLLTALRSNVHVNELRFRFLVPIGPTRTARRVYRAIADLFRTNATISKVQFLAEIDNYGFAIIAAGLGGNRTVTSLRLNASRLTGPLGRGSFRSLLAENDTITCLDLSGTYCVAAQTLQYDDETVERVGRGFSPELFLGPGLEGRRASLRKLSLAHCNLRDGGILQICGILRRATCSLRELDVGYNGITFRGLAPVAEMLLANNRLECLDLTANVLRSPPGNNDAPELAPGALLGCALGINRALKVLVVTDCFRDASDLVALFRALAQSRAVLVELRAESIQNSDMAITNSFVDEVAESLPMLRSLQTLKCTLHPLVAVDAMHTLLSAVNRNKSLTTKVSFGYLQQPPRDCSQPYWLRWNEALKFYAARNQVLHAAGPFSLFRREQQPASMADDDDGEARASSAPGGPTAAAEAPLSLWPHAMEWCRRRHGDATQAAIIHYLLRRTPNDFFLRPITHAMSH